MECWNDYILLVSELFFESGHIVCINIMMIVIIIQIIVIQILFVRIFHIQHSDLTYKFVYISLHNLLRMYLKGILFRCNTQGALRKKDTFLKGYITLTAT